MDFVIFTVFHDFEEYLKEDRDIKIFLRYFILKMKYIRIEPHVTITSDL